MCGIFGVYQQQAFSHTTAEAVLASLRHRGPDDEGIWQKGPITLGQTRLAILDTSPAGHQPMHLPSAGLTMVYNGEIYNYRELRRELGETQFQSQCDTEVVLRAYERWGPACLHKFIGMFALAIWDERKQQLFLARDRFGIKPLYYSYSGGRFAFASEPKALFAAGIAKAANLTTWANYLSFGLYEYGEDTFFKGIQQLRGGHYLTLSAEGLRLGRYYDLAEAVKGQSQIENSSEASAAYLPLMEEAVKLRFRADVPVGIAVSGGLDSSALIATVAKGAPDPAKVKAFTYTCGDPLYDEVPWAGKLLEGGPHPWHVNQTTLAQIPQLMAMVSPFQEEPFGGFNTLCLAQLCQNAANQGVTVLLDGNGLDEQWAGYEYYARANWDRQQFASGPVQGAKTRSTRPECLSGDLRALAQRPEFPMPFARMLDNLRYRDLIYTKIPRALRFSDRASMMNGRELRVPFLDHRLVELSFRLAPKLLIDGGHQKVLLRQMFAKHLPKAVALAPKRPLHTPQREWLAKDLAAWVETRLFSRRFEALGFFDKAAIRKAWLSFVNGPLDNSFFVWQWLSAWQFAAA